MNAGTVAPQEIWGDRPSPAHRETERLLVGPLVLWIRRVENEVWLTHAYVEDGETPPELPEHDVEWSRWAMKDAPHHIRIRPVFPDRPLVVKPEHPFTLLRRAEARVYMRVPLWVRIEAVDEAHGAGALLAEIPTEALSETWWGDFLDGELAYWIKTKARRALRDEHFESHMVICTLQLTNLSEDDLRVEKLALRVEHLSIFRQGTRLWAEEVEVDYHGEADGSEIHMDDHPPREAEGAEELTPARAQTRSLRARTFARLKALSGLGGL